MTKHDCLDILKLLSAMESWSLSDRQHRMPDYLHENLANAIEKLTEEILK